MKRFFCIVVVALVFAALVGCSATMTRRNVKEQWTDAMTSSHVKWKLRQDKLVGSNNIDINVWRGEVTMIGHVATIEEKARAEEVVMQVQGVRGVKNYIEVVGTGTKDALRTAGISKGPRTEPDRREGPDAGTGTKGSAKKRGPAGSKGEGIQARSVSEEDIMEETVQTARPGKAKRQNGVSYQIGRELASTGGKGSAVDSEMPPDDITMQAEQELKDLKAKRGANKEKP